MSGTKNTACWSKSSKASSVSENFVHRFEGAFVERTGRKYVHAVYRDSAANQAALAGLGVGPGDEIIVTPCSYIASSLSIVALGGVPVFADAELQTLHVTAESIEVALTPRAKAVVWSIYGVCPWIEHPSQA